MSKRNVSINIEGGAGFWAFWSLMYMFTSDTVQPIDKLEFWWRMMAGPFNFLPI